MPDSLLPVHPTIVRMIDANFNRAREALRVIEDYVRFVLDDPASCEFLKQLRHELAISLQRIPPDILLTARDTPGDVGTRISTPSEAHRQDALAVCIAAAKRLPEALRTLEEYSKTFDPQLAASLEALRYRSYTLEQRILLRGERSARFAHVRLYVLITQSFCHKNWLTTAEEVIAGGADCLQLREKDLDDKELLERAGQFVRLCRKKNVLCIINDRPDIARLADADGVHLGQTDLSVTDTRRIVGPDRLIGVSTHTLEQLHEAMSMAPDYIAVGPMFPSSTKPQDHVPGPTLLEQAVQGTDIPIVAIGGITPANVNALIQAGGKCICACSAVISDDEPLKAARTLKAHCHLP